MTKAMKMVVTFRNLRAQKVRATVQVKAMNRLLLSAFGTSQCQQQASCTANNAQPKLLGAAMFLLHIQCREIAKATCRHSLSHNAGQHYEMTQGGTTVDSG